MNDELITRLRETAVELVTSLEPVHGEDIAADLSDAADALEAAQEANEAKLNHAADLMEAATDEIRTLRAERDAEAALADSLAQVLKRCRAWVPDGRKTGIEADSVLAARRERRTATEDGDR